MAGPGIPRSTPQARRHVRVDVGRSTSMKTNKLLVAAVLAIAAGAPVWFLGEAAMSEPTTSTGVRVPFLHGFFNSQTAGHSELASVERANEWLNSPPLTAESLRGKVVLIDF